MRSVRTRCLYLSLSRTPYSWYNKRRVREGPSALSPYDGWVRERVPTPSSENRTWYSRIIRLRLEIAADESAKVI